MTLARPNVCPCLSPGSLSVFCTGRNFIAQGRGPEWALLGKIGSDRPAPNFVRRQIIPSGSSRSIITNPEPSQAHRIRISRSIPGTLPYVVHKRLYR
jgi:hypothetical protein